MADCATQRAVKEAHMWLNGRHRTPHSRTNFDETCQLTGTVRGHARRPHFSLAIISVTVQLWTDVFWVILAHLNRTITLPKSGMFHLGHPVYVRHFTQVVYTFYIPHSNILL
jgi:hypothetical protein